MPSVGEFLDAYTRAGDSGSIVDAEPPSGLWFLPGTFQRRYAQQVTARQGERMAQTDQWPGVHPLTVDDLVDVMAAGIRDFRAAPQYGLVFGGLFAAAGWLLIALLWYLGLPYLAYPLALGFALIAPFTAVGFYVVSDHLEKGKSLSWGIVFSEGRATARRDLGYMAFFTGFALILWLYIAAFLFVGFLGFEGFGPDLLKTLFTTSAGLVFLLLGNVIGALIAFFVFSISAVSFPMLYERDVDFVTAMVTSVRLVIANPSTMIIWFVVIGILMGISLLSGLIGLIFVLPVLGHATWHLYRRAVEPAVASGAVAV
jgi:uncharacterized membrane protein